jgi:uncharacterized repeat protein (TIGR04138 family)
MNPRDELARIIASDPRYALDAYVFVIDALTLARRRKLAAVEKNDGADSLSRKARGPRGSAPRPKKRGLTGHVNGRELCAAFRELAVVHYGALAATVLGHWGVYSTGDIGEIVFNMITAGGLEKTPGDSRSDFDDVFDFETALKPESFVAADDSM